MVTELRREAIVAELRARGQRITPQRLAILDLLLASRQHPSAAQLYQQLRERYPSSSLTTVYRTQHALEDARIITELVGADSERHYDGAHSEPHPHLICVRCRRVVDAPLDATGEAVDAVRDALGYRMVAYRLEYLGVCPECQAGA